MTNPSKGSPTSPAGRPFTPAPSVNSKTPTPPCSNRSATKPSTATPAPAGSASAQSSWPQPYSRDYCSTVACPTDINPQRLRMASDLPIGSSNGRVMRESHSAACLFGTRPVGVQAWRAFFRLGRAGSPTPDDRSGAVTFDDLLRAPVPALCQHDPGNLVHGQLPPQDGHPGNVGIALNYTT